MGRFIVARFVSTSVLHSPSAELLVQGGQKVSWCLTSLFSTNIWLYQGQKVRGGELYLPSIGRPAIYYLLLLLFTFNSRLEAHAVIYNGKNIIADKN